MGLLKVFEVVQSTEYINGDIGIVYFEVRCIFQLHYKMVLLMSTNPVLYRVFMNMDRIFLMLDC